MELDKQEEVAIQKVQRLAAEASCSFDRKEIEKSIALAEGALEQYRDEPLLWAAYSLLLCHRGRVTGDEDDYRLAIQKAQCGVKLNSQSPETWHALGQAQALLAVEVEEIEVLDGAIEAFEIAIQLNESLWAPFFDAGRALLKKSQITGSASFARAAVDRFERGESLCKAAGVEPIAEILFHHACALDFLGLDGNDVEYYREAITLFAKAHALVPENPGVSLHYAQAVWHWGQASGDLCCYQRAGDLLSEVVARDPSNGTVWGLWGTILASQARHQHQTEETAAKLLTESEKKFLRALRAGFTPVLYELARIYCAMNRIDDAMRMLEEAAQHRLLPLPSQLLGDPLLAPLRQQEAFQAFLARILSN